MNKIKKLTVSFFLSISLFILFHSNIYNPEIINESKSSLSTMFERKNAIKVALCTMGRKENLYIKEFIEYYLKLDIDHIFIYDDNEPGTEKMSDVLEKKYLNNVTIFNAKSLSIRGQPDAFTKCYNSYKNKFDWFLMVDMDEFLYIVNDTLKVYLNNKRFDKCDFIKIHWVLPTDNNLIYYDKRPLFERFKPPYINSNQIKSIIRGNIPNLTYWVHSPLISPIRNISCNDEGKIIYNREINMQYLKPMNIKKAFIIHFKYKSTEEFVNKFKRGYRNPSKEHLNTYLILSLIDYFKNNKVTIDKVNFIKKELNINLIK